MTHWLQKLFRPQTRTRPDRRRPMKRSNRPVLLLEPLENRVLPAFNLSIAGADVAVSIVDAAGVRTITATGTGASVNVATIQSGLSSGLDVVIDNGSTGAENGTITWTVGTNLDFTGTGVHNLLINADPSSLIGNIDFFGRIAGTQVPSDGLRLFFNAQNGIQMEASASIQNHQLFVMDASIGDYHQVAGSDIHTLSGGVDINGANIVLDSALNADLGTVVLNATATEGMITNKVSIIGGLAILSANRMDLAAGSTLNVGNGSGNNVTLQPFDTGRPINLDNTLGDPFSELRLSQTELSTITARILQIGNGSSGSLTIKSSIAAPAGWNTLALDGTFVSDSGSGSLVVTNLAIQSSAGVDFASLATLVSVLSVDNTGGDVFFDNLGALTIGSVAGIFGIKAGDNDLFVGTTNGDLTVSQAIIVGTGNITLCTCGLDQKFSNTATITNAGVNLIDVTADRMDIQAGITNTSTGRVILEVFSSDRPINLGPTIDPIGSLNLSNAELNNINTSGVLQIGAGIAGDISVTAAIIPTGIITLTLDTAGGISGPGTIAIGNLRLSAGNAIDLQSQGAIGGTGLLSAEVTNPGQGFTFRNGFSLQIGTVDTVSGITTNGGAIALSTFDGDVRVDQSIAAGTGAVSVTAGCSAANPDNRLINNAAITGSSAIMTADRMSLDLGTINVGTGVSNIVTLQPCTPGRSIDLGGIGDPTGTLQLSDLELKTITAGLARIGNSTAGNITVTAAIAPNKFSTLSLISGGGMSQSGSATLTIANLALQATGSIDLGLANAVSKVAGTTSNATFTFGAAGILTVGTVDNIINVNAGNGDVNLTVGGGATTGILVGQVPNDNIADVTGKTVTLTALGPTNGNAGQIGFFTTAAQFFEVAATTLNASTNNSRLWISAIGGTALGSINAGTNFAFLKAFNGNLTSTHTGSTPDVIANTVVLSSPATSGWFGSSTNPVLIQASTLRASVTGTGSINVTNVAAGGNLIVAQGLTNNGAILISTAAGDLTITAGMNAGSAAITLTAGGTDSKLTNSATITNDGVNPIILTADRMDLQAVITNTSTGRVTLQPSSAGRLIDLGSSLDPLGSLRLSNNELNQIQTSGVLQVGNGSAGNINVTADIFPASVLALSLFTGGGIGQNSGTHITAPELALRSVNAVVLDQGNNIGQALAGSVTGAGQGFTFIQGFTTKLTIGSVDGLDGITTNGGAIVVNTSNADLAVTKAVNAGSAAIAMTTGGADHTFTVSATITNDGVNPITLTADRMDLQAVITNTSTGRVSLLPFSANRPIDLGSTIGPTGSLNLSNNELNEIQTSGVLQVGSSSSGNITVSADIFPASVLALSLFTSGGIMQSSGTHITAPELALRSVNATVLDQGNNIGQALAGSVTNAGLGFTFVQGFATKLTVGTVDGLDGVTTNGGAIVIRTIDSDLQFDKNASAGAAAITLTAGGKDHTFTNNAAISNSGNKTIRIAADRMALQGGTITDAGSGTANIVTLLPITSGRPIELGGTGDPVGKLQLSEAELNTITAGILVIGDSSQTGNITVVSAITAPATWSTLSLIAGPNSGIDQSSNGSLTVTSLALSAQAGIGVMNALQTQVSNLEAETITGGIFIDNGVTSSVGLNIGGVDPILAGVRVTGTGASGDIMLTNNGSINITIDGETVRGPNDVTVIAQGSSSNVVTGGQVSGFVAILVTSRGTGDVLVQAGHDILAGAPNSPGNIGGESGNVTLTAARDIRVNNSGIGGLSLTATTAGNVTLNAGRDLNIANQSAVGVLSGSAAFAGKVTFTAGRDMVVDNSTAGYNGANTRTAVGISATAGRDITFDNMSAFGLSVSQAIQRDGAVVKAGRNILVDHNTIVGNLSTSALSATAGTAGLGNIIVQGGSAMHTAGGIITLATGSAGVFTLSANSNIDSRIGLNGGNINVSADNMTIGGAVFAGPAIVTLTTATATNTIAVGGADGPTTLGLDDTDLGNIAAGVVRIGSSVQTGPINIAGNITAHLGYNTLDLIATGPGGAITEGLAGSITVANLALQADSGIGSIGQVAILGPVNLAFRNTTSGNVQINSKGASTITKIDMLDGTPGHTVGNFAAVRFGSGTTSIVVAGPLTFAVDTTSSDSLVVHASESVTNEDITVNAGVMLESTGGDLFLESAGRITVQASATLNTDTKNVGLTVGQGDVDLDAAVTVIGTITSARNVNITSVAGTQDVKVTVVGTITSGAILNILSNSVDVQSTAILTAVQTVFTITPGGSGGTVQGLIAGTTNRVQKESSGTLILSNSGNTYGGGTEIVAGTLSVAADGNLGSVTGGVTFNGGKLITTATFATGRSLQVMLDSGLAIAGGTTLTLSGILSGGANLTKSDSGNLSLTGASPSFSGTIGFVSGALQINGLLGGGVAANADTVLTGIGTIGTLTGAAGATLNPGSGSGTPGVFTSGATTFAPGFKFVAEILGPDPSQYDALHSTATVDLAGASLSNLVIGPSFPAVTPPGTVLSLITAVGINGTFAGLPDGSVIRRKVGDHFQSFVLHYTPTAVTLTPVPEVNLIGAAAGQPPIIQVLNVNGTTRFTLTAFDPNFLGGVSTALGDVNGDGIADILAAAGPGGGPNVTAFNGADGKRLTSFFAFNVSFVGGVSIAAGDVNNDGFADFVAGAGPGGGPDVAIYSGKNSALLSSFFAFDPAFVGGISVAAADVNGDGFAEVIAGAGAGGGPNVTVWDGQSGAMLSSFLAYDAAFVGGVQVAAGDVRGTGTAQIFTGPGFSGGPNVVEFDPLSGKTLASFMAYDSNFAGGVRVGLGRAVSNGRFVILTGQGADAPAFDAGFDGLILQQIDEFFEAAAS